MKSLLLILSLTICICANSFAQLSEGYFLDKINDNYNCYLLFSGNGHYSILVSEDSGESDAIRSFFLSVGKYRIIKNDIKLFDNSGGFTMLLKKNNSEIEVIHSFKWFKNKHFIFDKKTHSNPEEFESAPKINASSILLERKKYNSIHKTVIPMSLGFYKSNGFFFSLNLLPNNNYSYQYKTLKLSEGTWSRNGNILILYDTTLKISLYALISNNLLISNILPGNCEGEMFFKTYFPDVNN
jgi:hypothetical protein